MSASSPPHDSDSPLGNLDEWEDDLLRRYPNEDGPNGDASSVASQNTKKKDEFRNYRAEARDSVKQFYQLNHQRQTLDFVRAKKAEFRTLDRRQMGIWEAMEFLNTLVDDSDPDTDVPQIEHLIQTAEGIRQAGHPRWFILTGLIHDLGKILCLFGEPQWAVVGDTFPVGCAFSEKIVFPEFFADNPDSKVEEYQTPLGVYQQNGGLDQVHLSWGHDEYLYYVVKDYLPNEALAMIRYHSFYAEHRERAYDHLMNEDDQQMFRWVRKFNPFDLYTKSDKRPDVPALEPFYRELIDEYFPTTLKW